MILTINNNCHTFDAYSSMTWRLMLKELDECIDDIMTVVNEFIGEYRRGLAQFEEFRKSNYNQ